MVTVDDRAGIFVNASRVNEVVFYLSFQGSALECRASAALPLQAPHQRAEPFKAVCY